MPNFKTDDGIDLYFEDTGTGNPIVFVHEFAGDNRSWEHQVRHFSRRYRCITYSARGYPPSEIPTSEEMYGQDRARDDVRSVMDHLDIEKAHIVGHSMGAFATLHFGLNYTSRARSLVLAGCGYGSHPSAQEDFRKMSQDIATMFRGKGMQAAAEEYSMAPGRSSYKAKDPRGHAEFTRILAEHSTEGSALTMERVQRLRPSLWDLGDQISALNLPVLVISGDEDIPCLQPGLFLKEKLPRAGLAVVPMTGHTINSEEPAVFNDLVDKFLVAAEAGRWPPGYVS
jgi:pimeloyl-ACP methyl ester carboxylesterase